MKEAMEMCPRFQRCSVNKCPLDADIELRTELGDETKCNMEKSVRLRIGQRFKLPKQGLTNKEFSSCQRWESKSEEEKVKTRERLAKNAFRGNARIVPDAFSVQLYASVKNCESVGHIDIPQTEN